MHCSQSGLEPINIYYTKNSDPGADMLPSFLKGFDYAKYQIEQSLACHPFLVLMQL